MNYIRTVLVLSIFLGGINGQTSEWTPEISIQLKTISDLNYSKDGDRLAMVVREALIEGEKSEYLNQIWIAARNGSDLTQYTYNEKSSSHPRFSPSGKHFAFLSERAEKSQIWVMSVTGGEPWQFTYEKQGVGTFSWSPNGSKIAFLMKDDKTEDEEKNEKEKKDVILVDQNFKYSHIYIKNFTTEVDTNKSERFTEGNYDINGFNWHPQGTKIVFSHRPEPTYNSGFGSGDISLLELATKEVKSIVNREGVDGGPSFSPNGRLIAFISNGGQREEIGLSDVFVVDSQGGKPRKLAETPNRHSRGIISWSPDNKYLYVNDLEKTKAQIYKINVKGNKITPILNVSGLVSSPVITDDGKYIAFVKQGLDVPAEMFTSELKKISPKKITDFNSGLKTPSVAKTEILGWKSKDGLEIEGLLTYPANYNNGKKYPLALIIHGGPAGVFTQSYTGNPGIYMVQYFASNGYAVLRPNPRGSTGYGKDFRYANFKDWGFGDYEDIMSGVDKVVSMGLADVERLGVMGWSYGGYMTSFVVTRTNRFKAASMGAGLPNLISMTSTTDIPDYLVAHMGGEFWDDYETYEKHSAIYRIKNVVTPTQILHGENDLRVPFTQGQEFYVALKRKGVPTEMAVYPRTPHGPREPKLLMDVSPRILRWFDKYIKR